MGKLPRQSCLVKPFILELDFLFKVLVEEGLRVSVSSIPSTSMEHKRSNSLRLEVKRNSLSTPPPTEISLLYKIHPSIVNSAPGSVSGLCPRTGGSVGCAGNLLLLG